MATRHIASIQRFIRKAANHPRGDRESDRDLLRRFAEQRDEEAFAAIVRRHGAMVLGVARRVLLRHQDCEDVCQATFLLLAQKANSVPWRDSVTNWLYGVAYRLALQSRDATYRRNIHETKASPKVPPDAMADITLRELQGVLDEELSRLPRKYSAPLLLCCLEGKARDEAAQCLGWPLATVKSRLEEGRDLLRRRLQRRGVALSTALAGATLSFGAAQAALPAIFAHATSRAAVAVVAGKATAEVMSANVSANVLALIRAGGHAMFLTKLKVATAVALVAGVIATGIVALTQNTPATAQALAVPAGDAAKKVAAPAAKERARTSAITSVQPPVAKAKPPMADEKGDTVEVRGRVVDPNGNPFAGAKVFFARFILWGRDVSPPPHSISDADGRFRLRISKTIEGDHLKAHWMRGAVVAVGKGFAPGWVGGDDVERLTNTTIRLAKEVPIEGRVIDLQGKPIAGVNVQLRNVAFRETRDGLKDFVEALRSQQVRFGWWNHAARPRMTVDPAHLGLASATRTGADGTFRFTGISAECLVLLRFEAPAIETSEAYAMTRAGPTIRLPADKELRGSRAAVFHGTTFEHAAAPTRPIVGVVRDKDTGKPLAGVTVRNEIYRGPGQGIELRATTDAEGRYRLVGLSREAGHSLLAAPPPGQPYLRAASVTKAAPGLEPVTVDFTLKRGVLMRGRVTDKQTGGPVSALVTYFAFDDNANLREAPGYRDSHSIDVQTGADGSFTVIGLAGRGLIAAKAADRAQQGHYLMAVGADVIKGPRDADSFITHPNICHIPGYNTLVEVDPARDAESIMCNIALDHGKTVTGTIVDPDGDPVKGASIDSMFGVWLSMKDLPTAQFRIQGVDPKHPRSFFLRDGTKTLGAAVLFKGDEPMPVTVRLQRCATITGRLVDEDGLPCAAWLMGSVHKGQLGIKGGVGAFNGSAGKDGRFRIEGVIPGLKIGLWAGQNYSYYDQHLVPELTLQPGEVRNLGDLKRKAD